MSGTLKPPGVYRGRVGSALLCSVVLVLVVGVTGACGNGSSQAGGRDGPTIPELSETELFPALSQALREARTYEFEMTRGPEGHRSTTSGVVRMRKHGLDLSGHTTSGLSSELVLVGGKAYMRSPDFFGHDKWVRRDLADPDTNVGWLTSVTGAEHLLREPSAIEVLEVVGHESVDGVPTNHYRSVVDYASFGELVTGRPAAGLDETIVVELWVDADDLLRRFVLTPEFEVTSAFGLPTEGTYSGFGDDVHIKVPPSGEVTDEPFEGG